MVHGSGLSFGNKETNHRVAPFTPNCITHHYYRSRFPLLASSRAQLAEQPARGVPQRAQFAQVPCGTLPAPTLPVSVTHRELLQSQWRMGPRDSAPAHN